MNKINIKLLTLCIICTLFFIAKGCKNPDLFKDIGKIEDEQTLKPVTRSSELTWDYPIKPGTDGWSRNNFDEDPFEKLNIPENILKELDTESLVQICLNYPAKIVLLSFNTPQTGFDVFYKQFNGIRELMSRKDAGHSLLKKYSSMTMEDFNPSWTLEEQGAFTFQFYYVELFLVQPQSLQSLGVAGRKLLLKEAVEKFDLKMSRNDLFGGLSSVINVWLLARTLHIENRLQANFSTPSDIEYSLRSGMLLNFDVQSVLQQAKNYAYE